MIQFVSPHAKEVSKYIKNNERSKLELGGKYISCFVVHFIGIEYLIICSLVTLNIISLPNKKIE